MSAIQQGKDIWNRLPANGKVATITAAVATLALIGAMVYFASQDDYGILFSDLKPEDAQSIVSKLKAEKIPYTLSNNGTTVSVPAAKVSELRLQMAGEGMLSGGHVGFDLFDKTNFGATDFAQQINYRRAIEGELSKTLEGMDEVEQARVHITPKKESVFTEKEEGAKASVVVRIKQGKELSAERTEAIVSLVSSAVGGLDPSGVSVMDTRGRLLTAARGGKTGFGDAGTLNAQLDAKRKFETETAARVIALIEPIAGEGRVRADVAADVDFSQTEQTEERYNPESRVIRSQQTLEERSATNSTAPTVAVGARANDPTAQAQAQAAQNTQAGNDQRTTNSTNWEIDKTVRRTIGGGGRIARMTVSVLIDFKTANDTAVARGEDELQKIRELVSGAVGTDQNRGDSVVVQTMAFEKLPIEEAAAAGWLDKNKQIVLSAIKYGSFLLIAALLFLFVIRPAKKALNSATAKPAADEPKLLEAPPENERRENGPEDITSLPPMTVAEIEAKMAAEDEETEAPMEEGISIESIRAKLTEQALAEPELIAGTLRGWLKD